MLLPSFCCLCACICNYITLYWIFDYVTKTVHLEKVEMIKFRFMISTSILLSFVFMCVNTRLLAYTVFNLHNSYHVSSHQSEV
jgi:hypothetical protein